MTGEPGGGRRVLTSMLLGGFLVALVAIACFVVIVVAALGDCSGLVPFETCDTGASTERVILGTLGVGLTLIVVILVWTVRRMRRAEES